MEESRTFWGAARPGSRSARSTIPTTSGAVGSCPCAIVTSGQIDCSGTFSAPGSRAAAQPGLIEPLTERELEVLRLLAAGRSNQRIAHELVVALDTVKKHVTHILGKLGAANRTEAAVRARQVGLIP